jgi:hypothetical protein
MIYSIVYISRKWSAAAVWFVWEIADKRLEIAGSGRECVPVLGIKPRIPAGKLNFD